MKNIHLLPTDKKIKNVGDLVKDQYGDIHIFTKNDGKEYGKTTTKLNIYITSDEEIKTGDWFITDHLLWKANQNIHLINPKKDKKIILTTDPQLIAEGVQPIDDEFLEWFLKNPSCEKVKVEKYHGIKTSIAEISAVSGNDDYDWQGIGDNRDYRIIIPKEEELFERANKMSDEELLTFGKSCFYKGFEKAKKDDANCYTAFREEIGSLILKFKTK